MPRKKTDALSIPEPTGPVADVWTVDGRFDSAKAAVIAEESRAWPPEQRAAMLVSLRAAETRAKVKTLYQTPAGIAQAIDPRYVLTPALKMIDAAIERVLVSPRKINLAITMPPQEGKSTEAAVWTPIRALQHNANQAVVLTTYAQSLAEVHSQSIRDIISTHGADVTDSITGLPVQDKIGLKLAKGANRVSAWSIEGSGGGFVAVGIGGPLTGRKADLLIIDDPFKNMMEADSATHREKVHTWFSTVALTRLSPSASIILIQCMTGDTPVLRPDGTETPLADIRPGDEIATYEYGALCVSKVQNWVSQGYDSIYAITMESGRVVRANARHPFLVVDDDGAETWVRVCNLKPGHVLMATASTTAYRARSATNLPIAKGCANLTTTKPGGPVGTLSRPRNNAGTATCATATASVWTTTTACLRSNAGRAVRVARNLAHTIALHIGPASSALTTATKPASYEGCCATTAMSSLGAHEQPYGYDRVRTISTDTVTAIEPCGIAEVFDIQVERTENFIANGLVSHNTRWHPEDLAGKILAGERLLDRSERTWRHINVPAIAELGIADALGREPGTPMESARDTPEAKRDFATTRRQVGERSWYALYQGSPRNPAGGIFQRAWFDPRLPDPPVWPVACMVGVDPADSGEGDEAGIIGGMLMRDGRVALTHDRSGQYTADQWSRQAVLLALEMGALEIAVEGYTAAKTYTNNVRKAYSAIHREAVDKARSGSMLTPVDQRAMPDIPPFRITQWRGPSKADAVARSGLLSQAFETGKCKTVEFSMAVFEEQAADWQSGQHQPDRVAAAVIVHDRLMALGGGTRFTDPAAPPPAGPGGGGGPPEWMTRRIG